MSGRISLINTIAATATLLISSALTQWQAPPHAAPPGPATSTTTVDEQDAASVVIDSSGTAVPMGDYRRIVSTSMMADDILPDLVHADRILAVTAAHRRHHPESFRSAHAAVIPDRYDLETLINHRPDLILVSNTTGDPGWLTRARELGYTVFDLGPMRGRESYLSACRRLGRLLRAPERGASLAERMARRLDRLPLHIPSAQRLTAVYCAAYGSHLYGGTSGSSYHDVLTAAGLIDLAAGRFGNEAWPKLSVEDLLLMDPAIIVTVDGGGERITMLEGMRDIDARIIEIDGAILGDPSLILPAAEALQQAVYGDPVTRSGAQSPQSRQ